MPVNKSVWILLFLLSSVSLCQVRPGARQAALANSLYAVNNDVFSIFNNPASLCFTPFVTVGAFYSPSPFGLKELASGNAAFVYPSNYGSFAAGYMRYGYENYNENKILLALSRHIEAGLYAGLSVVYHNVSIIRYGSDGAFYVIGGLVYKASEDFGVGFSFENPFRATFGSEENQIPAIYNFAASFTPGNIGVYASVNKEWGYDFDFCGGVEYRLIEYFALRVGSGSYPERFSAGLGISYQFVSFNYALFSHSDLGFTHQADIILSLND